MNVTPLKDANAEPVDKVVQHLETALAHAKAGRLRDVAIVGTLTGNSIFSAFSSEDVPTLAGLLAYQVHGMHQEMWETRNVGGSE